MTTVHLVTQGHPVDINPEEIRHRINVGTDVLIPLEPGEPPLLMSELQALRMIIRLADEGGLEPSEIEDLGFPEELIERVFPKSGEA